MKCKSLAEPIEAMVFFFTDVSINISGEGNLSKMVLLNSLIKSAGSLFTCLASPCKVT